MKNNAVIRYALMAVAVVALAVGGGALGSILVRSEGPSATPASRSIGNEANYAIATDTPVDTVNASLSNSFDGDIAKAFQQRFRAVSAATTPVVVEVNVTSTVSQPAVSSPFEFFLNPNGERREIPRRGLGSGVIVEREGDTVYVLTNSHVAGNADEIEVVLNDGRSFEAELVGQDDLMDLALVSFETDASVPIADLGDSGALAVGDWVFAVGNPLGYESTVTAGIVSAIGRDDTPANASGVTDYIQTDAAINRGNSGGPLVNIDGEVVGINTWIASSDGGSIGIGFAIPVNNARRAIRDFIDSGEVAYSWLGVRIGSVSERTAEELGLESEVGAMVYNVYENAPASRAGVEPGDVIVSVDGEPIDDSGKLVRTVAALAPGEASTFEIIRDGELIEIEVRTARREAEAGDNSEDLWPGFTVTSLTEEVREQLTSATDGAFPRRTRGVVVTTVEPGSPASDAGLRSGDVITEVNDAGVASVDEFYRALRSADDDAEFIVLRGGREVIVGFRR